MRRSVINGGGGLPPGGRSSFLQGTFSSILKGGQSVANNSNANGGSGPNATARGGQQGTTTNMYLAEAIPMKSGGGGRVPRPFPTGPPSFPVSRDKRLVRSAGILPNRARPIDAEERFQNVGNGRSGEMLQRVIVNTNNNSNNSSNNNNRRNVRDRSFGPHGGMRAEGNVTFSLTGNNKGRGGLIPQRARDREYPHGHHNHQHLDVERKPGGGGQFDSRTTRIMKGTSSVPKSSNPSSGTSHNTHNTVPEAASSNITNLSKPRRGDLEDTVGANTPLGLVSFFDGIHSVHAHPPSGNSAASAGTTARGGGRGKGILNFRSLSFDGFAGPTSTNQNQPQKISRSCSEDANPSNSSRGARKDLFVSPRNTKASERQKEIHDRYGGDQQRSSKQNVGVNNYGRNNNNRSCDSSPSQNTTKVGSSSNGSVTCSVTPSWNTNTNVKLTNRSRPPNNNNNNTNSSNNNGPVGSQHFLQESRTSNNNNNNPSSQSSQTRKEFNETHNVPKTETKTFTGLKVGQMTRKLRVPEKVTTLPLENIMIKKTADATAKVRATSNATVSLTVNRNKGKRTEEFFRDNWAKKDLNKINVSKNDINKAPDNSALFESITKGSSKLEDDIDVNNNTENVLNIEKLTECTDETNPLGEGAHDIDIDLDLDPGAVNLFSEHRKKCSRCRLLTKSMTRQKIKVKNLSKTNINLECLIGQKRELVEQLQQQVKTLMRENQHLAKIVITNTNTEKATTASTSHPNIIPMGKTPSGTTGIGFKITGKSSTSPVIPTTTNQVLTPGENTSIGPGAIPIQRKSLSTPSFLSSLHNLNPHRKVAMSPEQMKEAEDKINSLTSLCEKLTSDLDTTKGEYARIQKFLGDLFYTLNSRGFEAVTDGDGNVVDLNRCKGETYLELKGRDQRQKPQAQRRLSGNEYIFKAMIGSQEKMIQNLIIQLEALQRELLIGDKLCSPSSGDSKGSEGSKRAAVLESEILQLMTLLEGTCQRFPNVFVALREQHQLDSSQTLRSHSGRMLKSEAGVVEKILDRCEQLVTMSRSPNPVDLAALYTASKNSHKGQGQHRKSKERSNR